MRIDRSLIIAASLLATAIGLHAAEGPRDAEPHWHEDMRHARAECARKWQDQIRSGAAASTLWRDFYPACMKSLTGVDILQK